MLDMEITHQIFFCIFFLTGGYFALLILIIIFTRTYFIFGKILFERKILKQKNSFIFKVCFLVINFFSCRGLVENSFGLFSVDFLIVILCLFITNELYNNKIDTNFLRYK